MTSALVTDGGTFKARELLYPAFDGRDDRIEIIASHDAGDVKTCAQADEAKNSQNARTAKGRTAIAIAARFGRDGYVFPHRCRSKDTRAAGERPDLRWKTVFVTEPRRRTIRGPLESQWIWAMT
jgi:hypothetical protein